MKTPNKRENVKTGSSVSATEAPQRAPGQDEFTETVAKAAYFIAEQRGFAPGFEMQDWLSAEAELRAQLDRT